MLLASVAWELLSLEYITTNTGGNGMSLLSRDDLKTLMEPRSGWHISMFLPMQRAGVETQQNPIRCKNLLRQAEERLLAGDLRPAEVQTLLEPAQQLLGNYDFWQHQSDGLALFLAPAVFHTYCLPLAFAELLVVTQRFHVKPLLPLLSGDGQFYVLALSQNQVRLLQCTRHSVSTVELPDAPTSLAEALKYDDPERQLQFHTGTPGGTGRRAAMFHGQGVGIDDTKDNLREYFRQIDRGLHEVLRDAQAPLVLAGVEYLLPLYKEITTYAPVVEAGITGNPEGIRAEDLHQQAWSLVAPLFHRERQEAVARYRHYAGTGQASSSLPEIILAAYHGRVETVFVAVGVQQWGTFDAASQRVELVPEAIPESEDLLDTAAVHTFLNRGTVYAVPPDQVPGETPIAAVFRY
jgi:hypothetical protein